MAFASLRINIHALNLSSMHQNGGLITLAELNLTGFQGGIGRGRGERGQGRVCWVLLHIPGCEQEILCSRGLQFARNPFGTVYITQYCPHPPNLDASSKVSNNPGQPMCGVPGLGNEPKIPGSNFMKMPCRKQCSVNFTTQRNHAGNQLNPIYICTPYGILAGNNTQGVRVNDDRPLHRMCKPHIWPRFAIQGRQSMQKSDQIARWKRKVLHSHLHNGGF